MMIIFKYGINVVPNKCCCKNEYIYMALAKK